MDSTLSSYIGRTLDDRYLIRSHVGSGGMSRVFLAEDLVMHREVAIKMLREETAKDAAAVRRFIHEAKAVSMLSHPNVVSVFDVAMASNDKYIVLEYAEGITLKEYLRKNGPLSASEAIHIAVQILAGLEHAHGKGIIHRDIKPQNIIIAPDGAIKVTDFGIAKLPNSETITMADKAIGSVHYISPEQASGKPVDHRSDLYSLGIILYEMICNRLPFDAETAVAVACKQINEAPIPPSAFIKNVPCGLEQILMKAMSKRPDDRFEHAAQMLSCLKRLESTPDAVFDFVSLDAISEAENIPATDKHPIEIDADDSEVQAITKPSKSQSKAKKSNREPAKRTKRQKVVIQEITIKKDRFSMLPIIFGVLCALVSVVLVCGIYLLQTYFIGGGSGSQLLIVDDFVSRIYSEEMKEELEAEGYSVKVEWVKSSDHLANSIISQSPEKNVRRTVVPGKQPCLLTLVVCEGENLLTLPDYTGVEYREAQIEMRRNNLNYTIEKVYNSAIAEGKIISTYPKAGTVMTADTKVVVYVSMGGKVSYVTVPWLIKHNAADVAERLKNVGIRVGTITYEYSNSIEAGLVIRQSLTAGITVQSGLTSIDLVVSLGPSIPTVPPDQSTTPDQSTPPPDLSTAPSDTTAPSVPTPSTVTPSHSSEDTAPETLPPVTRPTDEPIGNDPNVE